MLGLVQSWVGDSVKLTDYYQCHDVQLLYHTKVMVPSPMFSIIWSFVRSFLNENGK